MGEIEALNSNPLNEDLSVMEIRQENSLKMDN
jgi:hypothetical protein